MVLHLNAASKTDVGQQREQNEDACYAHVIENDSQVSGLFVVADGMGGYHAGEVAAKIAVDTISELLQPLLGPTSSQPTVRLKGKRGRGKDTRESRDDPAKTRPLSETNHDGEMVAASSDATEQRSAPETQQLSESIVLEHYTDRLKAAVEQSSEAIVEYGRQHAEAKGLGSTVTVAMIAGDQAFIANVGDSRTYLFRDGKLHRLTHDHSLVERLVEAGQIEPEEVYDHPHRNLIYRSLGANKAEVEVDIFTERLKTGDVLLLCSDGLWEMVRDPQLESILGEVSDPAEATDILIERANENGGEDNITAVLVRYVEG
ncbi:MAG TPA: PP2C family serine/threonine-protein phosphatase [Ktedonobacterales bacterium]|nr:PP2C family serine/threonine-protein phosphatase [Ktedonobacterales bacterium]